MKKSVLVVSYSQTGQLSAIVDSFLSGFSDQVHIDHLRLDSIYNYDFPWSMQRFFEVFPGAVLSKIEPHFLLEYDKKYDKNYDLIILGYQPWFLSPSIPMSSFLQSNFAQKILSGKPVVTLIGCRNMWTRAQEAMKKLLHTINAHCVGTIVLYDKAYNFVSLFTILRWMLWGKKGNSGIAKEDIEAAKVYGQYISDATANGQAIEQKKLVAQGAVKVIPHLVLMEQRAFVIFLKFAQFIDKEQSPQKKKLKTQVFQLYLFLAILIASPISLIITGILRIVHPRKYKQIKAYYAGVG